METMSLSPEVWLFDEENGVWVCIVKNISWFLVDNRALLGFAQNSTAG
jgi:hypothetical protein